jgi:hypothetical protein
MTTVNKLIIAIVFMALSMLIFTTCDNGVNLLPDPTPPATTTFTLTMQVEKEGVIDNTITTQKTVDSGATTALAAGIIADHLFIRWEIVSGTGAVLGNARQVQTDITIQADTVVKAVYLKAYLNPFNGHYYKLYNGAKTWVDAKVACESVGGYLVTITSQEEQNFINIILNRPEATGTYYAYGGLQPAGSIEPVGNWQWVTGEPWSYTNWNSG